MQSTYFIGRLAMPAGSTLTLHYTYPHARYFQFALYKAEHNTFVSHRRGAVGARDRARSGFHQPVPGRRQPARRAAQLHACEILAEDAPADAKTSARATRCMSGKAAANSRVREPHSTSPTRAATARAGARPSRPVRG